jgi:hypothetical protein
VESRIVIALLSAKIIEKPTDVAESDDPNDTL